MSERKIVKGMYVNVFELKTIMGMFVTANLLTNRRLGSGKVLFWIPGHGGDVWLIEHPDKTRAVYSTNEMVPVYAILCKKCGKQMDTSEIKTVADKAIVDMILESTDLGIGINRCECGERVYILTKKEDNE